MHEEKTPSAARAALWVLGLLLLAVGAVACGMPISAEDLTLTPPPPDTPVIESTQPVTRAPLVAAAAASTAAPVTSTATPAGTGTPSGSVTPNATGTVTGTVTATSTPDPLQPSPTVVATPTGDFPTQAFKILNDARVGKGLQPLTLNASLAKAAAGYACLMGDKSWFVNYATSPHDGPDGSSPESRIAAAGYTGRFRGETLAAGQTSAADVITTWDNSAPHHAIIFDQSAVDVGIGYCYKPGDVYGHYWVLETGIP